MNLYNLIHNLLYNLIIKKKKLIKFYKDYNNNMKDN